MVDEKYKNKYRIASIRLRNWDYRWAGAYFITICTRHREHYFGEIVNTGHALYPKKMQLSNIGVIADILWHEIKNHAKNIELGAFIVMPNHIHGILILNDNVAVETLHATSLPQPQNNNEFMANISPKSNSISTIIRSYKSAVTKHARRLGYDFGWQPRFYDHIIRNEKSFNTISNYIINNPSKWNDDNFFDNNKNIVMEPQANYGNQSKYTNVF
ncbi:MAG: transposase [Bacteroidales bacterium]|nr:transposase [Bacteroidales bacterium]